jgi:hypothetical protein
LRKVMDGDAALAAMLKTPPLPEGDKASEKQ